MGCEWTFKPSRWEERFNTQALPNEPIECGRKIPSGADYCQYHEDLRANDNVDITPEEAFKSLLDEDGDVFGARFQLVDLSDITLNQDKIRLKNVIISSRFKLDRLNSKTQIRFSNSVFDEINFQDFTLNERFEFKGCHVRGQATFRDIRTSAKVQFDGTIFKQNTRIAGHFSEPVEFLRCEFESGVLFRESSFRKGLKLKRNTIEEDVYIHDCEIGQKLDFSGSDPERRIFLSKSDLENIDVLFDTLTPTLILFHGTTLRDGVLHQPENAETYFDLTNATLGEVHLRPEYDLNNYYFNETKYEGFQFYLHRNQFGKKKWRIHEFIPELNEDYFINHRNLASGITPPPIVRYKSDTELKDKSETYLLARMAASRQGDNISASKLHIVEMKSRKERYKHSVLQSDGNDYFNRGIDAIRYMNNQFHRIISIYGESPFRIFWLSALGIVVWAAVIAYLGGVTDGSSVASLEMIHSEEVTIWGVMKKNLHMSAASFTTMGSSLYRPATSAAGFATMLAGFIGPFMMALFVFTLGRQIRR